MIEAHIDLAHPSAARVLEEPQLVAQATGTCVVPLDKQRLHV
ncbi:hypothetical protein JOD24_001395 [Kroppenstedtia sanguinis]